MASADILAVVEDQFYVIRHKLDGQIERTAKLQRQVNVQRKEMAELHRSVHLTHRLLKQLVSKAP